MKEGKLNISEKLLELNKNIYNEKYANDYGVVYPEGHIIRINKHILQHELNIVGGKIFDYGCGTGIHLKYFTNCGGWECYGADINEMAIEKAKKLLNTKNVFVVESKPNLIEIFKSMNFNDKFNVILANQVLYYLSDNDLEYLLSQFNELLADNGVIIATMMGIENYYYLNSKPVENTDFRKVVLSGRINETTYVNFKTKKETEIIFTKYFKKLHMGYYDSCIREDEGSGMHYAFVGKKLKTI